MVRTDGASEKFVQQRNELIASFENGPEGLAWCHRMSDAADRLLMAIAEEAQESFPDLTPVALVATGGYGRRELSPYSDIDLTVVPLDESDPNLDPAIRFLFNRIHAAFGSAQVDVGYNYRLIGDMAGLDAKTRTGLIDSRFVAGNHGPLESLQVQFWQSFPVGEFLVAKIEERLAAIRRSNDSPLVIEPNLKEGAGGLRSWNCANWLRTAIGLRPVPASDSYETIVRIRNFLHFIAGRKLDLLNRSRQGEIAERLGIHPNELLESVAVALLANEESLTNTVDELMEARYPLSDYVHAIRGEARIQPNAPPSDVAIGLAMATQIGLKVERGEFHSSAEVRGPQALAALSKGEKTIRNLDRSGVLKSLLPEFTALRTFMPSDITHSHSVFEHTLRALRSLEALTPGSGFYGVLKEGMRDIGPLTLAILLHDAGKPISEPDHSSIGAAMAKKVCKRWGLERDVSDLVSWAIAEHLTMVSMSQMRDVSHPATARELAKIVKTADRLDFLTLLSYADASAVGEDNWNSSQDQFLRELYERTLSVLRGQAHGDVDDVARDRIAKRIVHKTATQNEVADFVAKLPAHYLLSTPDQTIQAHLAYSLLAQAGEIVIEFDDDKEANATAITVCCSDRPGLLSRALGTFYAFDLSLVGLRACTTSGEKPIAIDVFTMTHGGKQVPIGTASRLRAALHSVFKNETLLDDLIKKSGKDSTKLQRIHEFHFVEGDPGILEIRASRSRGMAYRFSRIIATQGWNIVSARGSQWAGMGVVTFYILDANHRPLSAESVHAVMDRLV